jgi:AraC family transcriptional regulator
MEPSERNRAEYQRRVNRVLDHIREHRSEELTLEALAAVASFSPFHFHRVFKATTGETVQEHIQRSRLENAATALYTRPHAEVLEIALENGFASASSFARAFRQRFGMSATDWRRRTTAAGDGKPGQAESKPGQAKRKASKAGRAAGPHGSCEAGAVARDDEEDIMDVKVETLPRYHVAYLRTIGPYGPGGAIPELWQKLARWAEARDLWTGDRICLGISHDNPKVTDPAKCRYDAAIVIPDGFKADGGVNVTDVEGGKYALAAFVGTAVDIGPAYDQLFGRWLPGSGYQPDNRLIFERYRGEFMGPDGKFRCDLCLPVRPL